MQSMIRIELRVRKLKKDLLEFQEKLDTHGLDEAKRKGYMALVEKLLRANTRDFTTLTRIKLVQVTPDAVNASALTDTSPRKVKPLELK